MRTVAFEVMYDEWKREGESSGLMRIPQTEYMTAETHLQIYEEHPDVSDVPRGAAVTSESRRRSRADLRGIQRS
jgi:hypothetical protein